MYPCLKVYVDMHIDGKRVGRRKLSRSFVQGMARLVYTQMAQVPAGAQNTTAGASVDTGSGGSTNSLDSTNAAASGTKGIVIGTGSAAVTPSDAALVTKIAQGSGAGQMSYQIQQFVAPHVNTSDVTFQMIRSFVNNSGGSITVNEFGIYASIWTGAFYCLVRDVPIAGIVVANLKTLTITYTFSFAI